MSNPHDTDKIICKEKTFLRNVRSLQRDAGMRMDQKNEAAFEVAETEGMAAAARHMITTAHHDYSTMRSMYG